MSRFRSYHQRNKTFEERFWEKVSFGFGPNACWTWVYGTEWKGGYGRIKPSAKDKISKSHRISWELCFGEIPQDLCVLHKCDNPACVNPKHLFLGTQQDNISDMVNKNRNRCGVGSKNKNAKLTENQVIEIRELFNDEIYNQEQLSSLYGVKKITIKRIIDRKSWTHV